LTDPTTNQTPREKWMLFKEFEKKIKRLNPKLRIFKFGGPVWGMHIHQPRHEFANEHGCVHLFSVTSPWWYGQSMPEVDRLDSKGRFMRGWRTCLRLLVDKHLISDSKAHAEFGYRWRWN
jgi:hypothetical protein